MWPTEAAVYPTRAGVDTTLAAERLSTRYLAVIHAAKPAQYPPAGALTVPLSGTCREQVLTRCYARLLPTHAYLHAPHRTHLPLRSRSLSLDRSLSLSRDRSRSLRSLSRSLSPRSSSCHQHKIMKSVTNSAWYAGPSMRILVIRRLSTAASGV